VPAGVSSAASSGKGEGPKLDGLIDPVCELIAARRFAEAESLLATAVDGTERDSPVDAPRAIELCGLAAEHHRLATQLAASAKRHESAERDVAAALDDLVGKWRSADAPPMAARDAAVDVRMLGPLDVAIDGRQIARWGSLKARAVFEYLAFHGGKPIRREVLMDVFWPGHSGGSARNNLNVALHKLRGTLQGGRPGRYVTHTDGCYALDAAMSWWFDTEDFLACLGVARDHLREHRTRDAIHAFERAVELYRGPLFEDDTISEWHLPDQRRMEDLYLQALEHLGELHLELGDSGLAGEVAHQAVASDPCRESAHRLLMRCYAEQHQHHLVKRQLQICASTLRRQLGISPAPETLNVFESLTTRA
jgi:DNA-binding SARP family transcriptional activator